MANIAYNEFMFSSENNKQEWVDKFDKLFEEELDGEITYCSIDYYPGDTLIIEGYFECKWDFPEEIFVNLIPEDENDVYFRCITTEFGCGLVSCAIYKNNGWKDMQFFDL